MNERLFRKLVYKTCFWMVLWYFLTIFLLTLSPAGLPSEGQCTEQDSNLGPKGLSLRKFETW